MAVKQDATVPAPFPDTLPNWARRALGCLLCLIIATCAQLAAVPLPLIGAPIFAIAIGIALTNTMHGALPLKALCIGDLSKMLLKGGIVLLGASLDFSDIVRTGMGSLPLLFTTIGAGLICSLGVGKLMGIDWRTRCLIGMGTTICGASAIAALSPVIRAKAEAIAYSVTVVFLFNMIAVFTFPSLGHLLSLTDHGFGIWAGTAVNDTSAVVAAGFAYSQDAGTTATIVKLTRTTLIIPLVIGFGLALPLFEAQQSDDGVSLARRVYNSFPTFILLFLLASLLRTTGLTGAFSDQLQLLGRWVMVVALAAVGLQGHWRAFAGAGAKPLVLGFLTWLAVALSSLAVQSWTGDL